MADTVVTDAAIHPSDEGLPNIADGNEDWQSAGLAMLLGQAVQSGSYIRSDQELDFSGHDGTNDTVDVQPGVAYLSLAGETIAVQSDLGGSAPPDYDTTLTTGAMPAICVVIPSAVTVNLQDSTLSDVWLAYATDGTVSGVSAGDVYLRSDDTGSVTAPPHPSANLGRANPDNSGADELADRFAEQTVRTLEASGSLSGPTASEGDVVTLPDNPDVVPIFFDAQTGEPLYPDLEETV